MARCAVCGCTKIRGVCCPPKFRIPKKLTDKEASKIVLPDLKGKPRVLEGQIKLNFEEEGPDEQ